MLKEQPVSYVVIRTGNQITFLLKLDVKWLRSPDRKFPLAIDPTVYPNNAVLWTGWANINGGNNDTVFAGFFSDGYPMVGFSRFNLTSIPDTSLIGAVTSNYYYFGRNGAMGGREMAIVAVEADPLTVPLYSDIAYSVTQYISSNFVVLQNNPAEYKINNFSAAGLAFVQDGLQKNFVTTAAFYYDINTWNSNNYAAFYGYSGPFQPYLTISYTPTCTTPSSSVNTYYIDNVQFLGSLIANTTNTTGYTAGGYYSLATNMATQIPGGVINVYVSNTSTNPPVNGTSRFTKAWVDWNKNGIFDSTEKVFDSGSTQLPNTIFGFVVPLGTTVGDYNIRIRNFADSPYYIACGSLTNGETEDYSFKVIGDCIAKITAVNVNPNDGRRCGTGTVQVSASGTGSSYQWYTDQFGASAIPGATLSTFTTPSLGVGTYTYYVTATNGLCESVIRTPVKAVVSPLPNITFTQSNPDICGNITALTITSSGDKEEVDLLNEKFSTGLGNFANVAQGNTDNNAFWKLQSTPYVPAKPPYYVLSPAMSSGYNGGGFAAIVTDVKQNTSILNHLTYTQNLNSTGYLNLKLDYDLFYYSLIDNDISYGYFQVDYSIDGGIGWTQLNQIVIDQGSPSRWLPKSSPLPAVCLNKTNLRIRFTVFAWGIGSAGWVGDIGAIDNVRLYGDKPLAANFMWSGDPVIFNSADCTSAPPAGGSPGVCIQPPVGDLETKEFWTINATAILSNGCSATGTINIPNNSKIWNTASTNWNTTNWKPNTAVPGADKCVIIKTPVILNSATNGLAKNLTVKSTGSLNIAGNLTVTDFVKNEGATDNLTLASDGNLIQTNATAPNSGNINAERRVTDMDNVAGIMMDYVYWSAPVSGQQTKGLGGFSPGTPNDRFFRYNEPNDRFYETGDPNFVSGKGYAVQAETSQGFPPNATGYTKTYHFRGTPNNGDISFNISRSANTGTTQHGFNLIGNPYPSNIDFNVLYTGNSGLIYRTVYFWTNSTYEQSQQGSGYAGNNYAVYNGAGGNPPTGGSYTTAPNGIVKVGQGVIIQKQTVGGPAPLQFKNSYGLGQNLRVTTSGTFYQKGETPVNRFWIKLLSPENLSNTQLIAYLPEASNGYDPNYDAEILGMSSDVFYSEVEDKKVLIQGKSDFAITDKVLLGANFFKTDTYTIALEGSEGIFASGQHIYLKDKSTGVVTDLSQDSYTFQATAGISEGRLEIIYKPETVLATDAIVKESLNIYRDGNHLVIKAQSKKITDLEIFDASGRLMLKLQPNATKAVINADMLVQGVYVLKVNQNGLITTKKIIK